MGTRNTTTVRINGKKVIAQYGQWDGYPTGQGAEFLHFFESDYNVQSLVGKFLDRHIEPVFELITPEDYDRMQKAFDTVYKFRQVKSISAETYALAKKFRENLYANKYDNRDWGCSILYAVAYGNLSFMQKTFLVDRGLDTWGEQEGNYQADIETDENGNVKGFKLELEYHGSVKSYDNATMPRGKEIDTVMAKWEKTFE